MRDRYISDIYTKSRYHRRQATSVQIEHEYERDKNFWFQPDNVPFVVIECENIEKEAKWAFDNSFRWVYGCDRNKIKNSHREYFRRCF